QAVQDCDVLFFCVPISVLEQTLAALQESFARRQQHNDRPLWLMDTCSVKERPLAWMNRAVQNLKPEQFRILGLHPMFGPDSAGDSPEGLRLVLCPQDLAEAEWQSWQEHFSHLGLHTVVMSAAEHDREAAKTQGLTHLLGRLLEALNIRQSPIATAGYQALCQLREQTCHDTWQLFLDLQKQNNYTPLMRGELQKALETVYNALENGAPENKPLGVAHGGNTREEN
ncbi:MAG: prephenate dehydrogenase/arogenate dehydrogenase family protein, partial [Spirochaetota bacterium]